MNIPVVVISDNKLSFAVGTLFVNLMETKSQDTFYELNVIFAPDVSDDNIARVKSIEQMYKGNCSINIIKMDSRFDNIKNETHYIANACAYKMCLAELFPQYDKVIYLDTDIIVFEDLQELYEYDVADNYIAGVFSEEHYYIRTDLPKLLQIPDLTGYVNAGILVFNLSKIRQDNIEPKLHALIGSFKDSVDQHIFNKVCYGKIMLLPKKWNVCQSSEPLLDSPAALIAMTEKTRKEIFDNPAIYHYTDPRKPWLFYNLKYSIIWQRYYKKSPFADKKLTLRFSERSVCNTKFIMQLNNKKNKEKYLMHKILYIITHLQYFKVRMQKYQERINFVESYYIKTIGG